jgi:hypothetical protein
MTFTLDAGRPAFVAARDESDSTVSDAMQTVFPLEERALLEWNGVAFPLGYKYDLSVMLDDIVEMVLAIREAESGSFQVDWPSSGFPYQWTIGWDTSWVEVQAHARDEPGAMNLSGRERVRVHRGSFVAAWRALLGTVLSCLEEAGYGSLQLHGLDRLRRAVSPGQSASRPGL